MIAAIEWRGGRLSGPVGLPFSTGVVGWDRADLCQRDGGRRASPAPGRRGGDQQWSGGTSSRRILATGTRVRRKRASEEPTTREPEMGFEPMTYHLRGGCSATELLRRVGRVYQRGPAAVAVARPGAGSTGHDAVA